MTVNDLNCAPWGLGGQGLKNFLSLFSGLPSPVVVQQLIANSLLCTVRCIDAYQFLRQLMPLSPSTHIETMRGVIAKNGDVFAWEFRLDTKNWMHRFRRIYNLVLGLIDAGNVSLEEVRKKLTYVVVRDDINTEASLKPKEVDVLNVSLSNLVENPWEYDVEDVLSDDRKKDERKLTGFICKKCYLIYEREIDSFIRYNKWR